MIKEKTFKKIYANIFLMLVLVIVSFVAFSGNVVSAFNYTTLKAYYSGNRNFNNVSLMINVYWGDEFLPQILHTLKKYNISITFFIGGLWAEKNEELLNQIVNDGHEIANHGYLHKDSSKISEQRLEEEIVNNHKLIKSLCNVEMNLFAPPSGDYNESTIKIANKLGYLVVMWTKDTIDWRDQDETLIYNRAIHNASNGDLILMHPTQATTNALPRIIEFYISQNFNLTTVSNNLGDLSNNVTN